MSQVVVTRDQHRDSRKNSLHQERKINRDSALKKWQLSDATKVLPSEKFLGVITLPVFLFWGLIAGLVSCGVAVSLGIFRILAAFWPSSDRKK